MSEQQQRSATVIQFPEWPRARAQAERQQRQERDEQLLPATISSSAWYHAAAMEDEPQAS